MRATATYGAESNSERLEDRGLVARHLVRIRHRMLAQPWDTALGIVAIGVCAWVLFAPFAAVKYPPMTDLPMHAATISALRHWFDKSWHFQDQFELHLFEVPVLSHYLLGAAFALFMPISWAVKLSTSCMLSLLPIGLAVYCWGLRKNPLFGVSAAALAWGPLAQWGFINYVASLGLTMMGLGATLLLIDRPTKARALGLTAVSLILFFTHVSRFPIYCAAIAVTTIWMLPVSRRIMPVLLAVAPAVGVFSLWWFVRPSSLTGTFEHGWHFDRVGEIRTYLVQSFGGAEESELFSRVAQIILGVGTYSIVVNCAAAWMRGLRRPRISRRALCAFGGTLSVVLMFAGLFFWLPMSYGLWWFVYPREITGAALCSLALLPSLPRKPLLTAPAVAALLVGIVMPMRFVADRYAQFEQVTMDFQKIIEQIPLAPKLGYIVWDHSGFESTARPFLHLPAWVQAERGGWLSFHFATWNQTPVRFRTKEPKDVAPDTPLRFEWNPQLFDLQTRGKYFNWFLVRAGSSPDVMFAVDPALHRVDHQGTWWLYKRD
jgi:hypothetical protein